MVKDFEGYSEQEIEALKALGLIDADLVDEPVPEVVIEDGEERVRLKEHPNITVKKNRQNALYVSREEEKIFGSQEVYLGFIRAECKKPGDLIVKGTFNDLSYYQNLDPDLFNGRELVTTNIPGKDHIKIIGE